MRFADFFRLADPHGGMQLPACENRAVGVFWKGQAFCNLLIGSHLVVVYNFFVSLDSSVPDGQRGGDREVVLLGLAAVGSDGGQFLDPDRPVFGGSGDDDFVFCEPVGQVGD